ncbi:MAG: type 4a pilus biogenesis protein PilO [Candidatus Omnitrophica bacterium]|nr:type 4a pilus biogenesis protein PilO [Candidatus Omnitrophota bacterium]
MDNAGLTAKIKENAITVLVLVIAVIIAFKVYQSKEIEIQKLNTRKAEEEQKNAVLGEIGGLENKLENLKKNFTAKEPKTGMEKIGDIAKSASVQIVRINPLKETVSNVYTKYPYEVILSAKDYHQVGKFISLLENSPDSYLVENLVINSNAAGGTVSISASLTVYTIIINK